MNCQTSGGKSARWWVMSQSFSIAHSCSTSLSRKACSSSLKAGLGKASSLSQSGCPLNRSPSHHTVPASIASCSVAEMGGSILRNSLSTAPLITVRRNTGIPKNTMNRNSAIYTTCKAVSEMRAWIATTGTTTITASTQLVIEARKNASRTKIANATGMVNAIVSTPLTLVVMGLPPTGKPYRHHQTRINRVPPSSPDCARPSWPDGAHHRQPPAPHQAYRQTAPQQCRSKP